MYGKTVLWKRQLTGWTVVLLGYVASGAAFGESRHVWEKVEITLRAEKSYENPCKEVEVWEDLAPATHIRPAKSS
jgi:hypothetical protein